MTEDEARRVDHALRERLAHPMNEYDAAAIAGVERLWVDYQPDGHWFIGLHFAQGDVHRGYRQVSLAYPFALKQGEPEIEPEHMAVHLYDLIVEPHGMSGTPDAHGRYWW